MKRMVAAALLLTLSACVVVPQTVYRPNPACRTVERSMELQAVQLAWIQGCSNEGCAVLLAAAGVSAAASAVVSGSIAAVGNIVYRLERQGNCPRAS